jgi:hypothetical protein
VASFLLSLAILTTPVILLLPITVIVLMDPSLPSVVTCTDDSGCGPLQICFYYVCMHKDLFPLSAVDFLVGLLVLVVAGITNAAGISDRYLVYIVLMTEGGFNSLNVHQVLYIAVFFSALGALVYRFILRHMTRDRPRIDYNLAMQACMPVLLGSYYGAMLRPALSSWLDLLLFILVVGVVTFVVFNK